MTADQRSTLCLTCGAVSAAESCPTPAQNDPAMIPPVLTVSRTDRSFYTHSHEVAQRARGRLAPRSNAAKQSATDPDAHDLESFGTVCAFTARASSRAGASRGAMCAHQQLRVG